MAIRKISESMMDANAAIARGGRLFVDEPLLARIVPPPSERTRLRVLAAVRIGSNRAFSFAGSPTAFAEEKVAEIAGLVLGSLAADPEPRVGELAIRAGWEAALVAAAPRSFRTNQMDDSMLKSALDELERTITDVPGLVVTDTAPPPIETT